MRPLILSASLIALLATCSSTPEVQTGEDAEVLEGTSLHRVDNSRADLAYKDPDADFSRYNRVMIQPLGVDNVEIIQPNRQGTSVGRNLNWELTDEDKLKLQQAFHDAMVKRLEEKGGYPIVDEPGDDVLEIAAKLLAIAPSAARSSWSAWAKSFTVLMLVIVSTTCPETIARAAARPAARLRMRGRNHRINAK